MSQASFSSCTPPPKPESNSQSVLLKVVGIRFLSNSCSDVLSPPLFFLKGQVITQDWKIYVKAISSVTSLTSEKFEQELIWLHNSSFLCNKWNNLHRSNTKQEAAPASSAGLDHPEMLFFSPASSWTRAVSSWTRAAGCPDAPHLSPGMCGVSWHGPCSFFSFPVHRLKWATRVTCGNQGQERKSTNMGKVLFVNIYVVCLAV